MPSVSYCMPRLRQSGALNWGVEPDERDNNILYNVYDILDLVYTIYYILYDVYVLSKSSIYNRHYLMHSAYYILLYNIPTKY